MWKPLRVPTVTLVFAATLACEKDDPLNIDVDPDAIEIAVLELSFRDIGKPHASASVTVARTTAALEEVRTTGIGVDTIVMFEAIAVGVLDRISAGIDNRRFVYGVFRMRNAFDSATVASLQNVTLIPIKTNRTIRATPFRTLLNDDGSIPDSAFAALIQPTGPVSVDADGNITVVDENAIRFLSGAEMSQVRSVSPADVFPYGFVVRPNSETARDGVAVVGFSLPLLEVRAQNPVNLSILFAALRDPMP